VGSDPQRDDRACCGFRLADLNLMREVPAAAGRCGPEVPVADFLEDVPDLPGGGRPLSRVLGQELGDEPLQLYGRVRRVGRTG
jgi:hypothetical protein